MTPIIALKEIDDDFQEWLRHIGFWNDEIASRVDRTIDIVRSGGKKILPMDIEIELRDFLRSRLNGVCLKVLRFLQSDSNGITTDNFDRACLDLPLSEREIEAYLASGECICDTLLKMGLIRIDEGLQKIFKPLKISFDPRVTDLIGLRPL